jgi:hypothetical protein
MRAERWVDYRSGKRNADSFRQPTSQKHLSQALFRWTTVRWLDDRPLRSRSVANGLLPRCGKPRLPSRAARETRR